MDIRQLRYFIAVAEHLNFTEAAKHLFITQSALSQQIAELERILGVSLFARNKHSAMLTPAGNALLYEARNLIERAAEAVRVTREAGSGITGRLRIGYHGFAEKRFLPQFISEFRCKFPHIELHFQQYTPVGLDEALDHADIDVGFITNWEPTKLPRVYFKPLFKDSLCLVVPLKHPLTKEACTYRSISKEHYVFHKNSSPRGFENLLRICSNRGFAPDVSPVPDLATALIMVGSGFGISLLPRIYPENSPSPSTRIVDFEGEDTGIYYSAAWSHKTVNSSVSIFVNALEEFFDQTLNGNINSKETL